MASLEQNPEEINYRRLHYLIIKHGTIVLRSKFDWFIAPDQLHTTLQTKKNMDRIRYALKNKIINPKEHAKLFPPTGKPNSQNFDISLLIYLLRHICGLDTKSRWWNEQDNSLIPKANSDIETDIVRVRNLRNKLHHSTNGSLDKHEFESDWALAEEVLLRIAGQVRILDMKKKINDVETATNEPKDRIIYVRDDGYDNDDDAKNAYDDMYQDDFYNDDYDNDNYYDSDQDIYHSDDYNDNDDNHDDDLDRDSYYDHDDDLDRDDYYNDDDDLDQDDYYDHDDDLDLDDYNDHDDDLDRDDYYNGDNDLDQDDYYNDDDDLDLDDYDDHNDDLDLDDYDDHDYDLDRDDYNDHDNVLDQDDYYNDDDDLDQDDYYNDDNDLDQDDYYNDDDDLDRDDYYDYDNDFDRDDYYNDDDDCYNDYDDYHDDHDYYDNNDYNNYDDDYMCSDYCIDNADDENFEQLDLFKYDDDNNDDLLVDNDNKGDADNVIYKEEYFNIGIGETIAITMLVVTTSLIVKGILNK